MKYNPTLLAFAALFAIVYGVLFSLSYPRVEISGGIVALCVLLGVVTCLVAAALWNVLTRPKTAPETAPADAAAPVHPASAHPAARPPRRRRRRGRSRRTWPGKCAVRLEISVSTVAAIDHNGW